MTKGDKITLCRAYDNLMKYPERTLYHFYKHPSQEKIIAYNSIKNEAYTHKDLDTNLKISVLSSCMHSFTMGYRLYNDNVDRFVYFTRTRSLMVDVNDIIKWKKEYNIA